MKKGFRRVLQIRIAKSSVTAEICGKEVLSSNPCKVKRWFFDDIRRAPDDILDDVIEQINEAISDFRRIAHSKGSIRNI